MNNEQFTVLRFQEYTKRFAKVGLKLEACHDYFFVNPPSANGTCKFYGLDEIERFLRGYEIGLIEGQRK